MDFFEPPPPRREPPGQEHHQPVWAGPPDNALPGIVPVELIIVRSEDTAIAVSNLRAYPTGLEFTVRLRLRNPAGQDEPLPGYGPFDDPFMFEPFGRRGLRDEFLRFGVQFADGSKATNLGRLPLGDDQDPEPPVLMPGGGGGGMNRWDVDYWLWPLPPPGTLGFVCAWPARNIPESRVEVDAGPILEAAGRAISLWPEQGTGSAGFGWMRTMGHELS